MLAGEGSGGPGKTSERRSINQLTGSCLHLVLANLTQTMTRISDDFTYGDTLNGLATVARITGPTRVRYRCTKNPKAALVTPHLRHQ